MHEKLLFHFSCTYYKICVVYNNLIGPDHNAVNVKLIAKYIHAVKSEFRQFSRPLRGIGAIHFGYR